MDTFGENQQLIQQLHVYGHYGGPKDVNGSCPDKENDEDKDYE